MEGFLLGSQADNLCDFLDHIADLAIWDVTEASLTITAACVPALRGFIREIGSTAEQQYDLSSVLTIGRISAGHALGSASTGLDKVDVHSHDASTSYKEDYSMAERETRIG